MPNPQTQLNESQTEIVTALPVNSKGNSGVMAGVPTTSNSNTAACVVASDPTGLILTLTGVAAGMATITLSGLSSAGTFSSAFDVTVTGGPATGFTFSFATPTP